MRAIKFKEAWMFARSSPGVLALGAVNLLLLMFLLLAAVMPVSRDAAAEQKSGPSQDIPDIKPRREPPNLTAATQRPLFHKSRQMRIVKEQVAAPRIETVTAQQALRVTGIMRSNGERVVYINQLKSGDVLRLKVGDTVGEWTISEIRNDAVVVNGNGQNAVLEMAP